MAGGTEVDRPIEWVMWLDSMWVYDSDRETHERAMGDGGMVMQSVGFIAEETETVLCLAMDTDDNGLTRGHLYIPKRMIQARRCLTREKALWT